MCFVRSDGTGKRVSAKERETIYVSAIPWHHSHIVPATPHEYRIPVDPQCVGVQRGSKQVQGKCMTSLSE